MRRSIRGSWREVRKPPASRGGSRHRPIITEGGEKIGIVGATTQVLERISSPTGTEVNGFPKNGEAGDNQVEDDDMVLLAAQLQPVIDALIAQGVNKIIVHVAPAETLTTRRHWRRCSTASTSFWRPDP